MYTVVFKYQSTQTARNVGVLSEWNLLEVMHTGRAECQRHVSHARWNVILIVELKDKKRDCECGRLFY